MPPFPTNHTALTLTDPSLTHILVSSTDEDLSSISDASGLFGSKKCSYTLRDKRRIVSQAYPTNGKKKVRKVAKHYNISHVSLIRWRKSIETIENRRPFNPLPPEKQMDIKTRVDPEDSMFVRSGYSRIYNGLEKQTWHGGRKGEIPEWAQVHLIRFFDYQRELNLRLTTDDIIGEYCAICPELTEGVEQEALRQRIYRFQKRVGISDRATTHQAQNKIHCQPIMDDWVKYVKLLKLSYGIDESNVANFDETNVSFDCASKRTLNWKGEASINIATATTSSRCTVMIGCTTTGYKFPAFVIFKGKPGGIIERNELKTKLGYPIGDGSLYAVQSNAWMDEPLCLKWVNEVWVPWATHPIRKRRGLCLLLWDEFKGHMVKSVLTLLSKSNTIVEFIPPGYTSKLQVMDVGLNRPFKTAMGNCYHNFVRDEKMANEPGTAIKPKRSDVARWISEAWYSGITDSTITNTWRHIGLN
jgi:hypothetical protein